MASLQPEQPKVLLPDDIWIARKHKLSHLASFVSSSFQTTTHSQVFSTLDDIDSATLFNDQQSHDALIQTPKSSNQSKTQYQHPLEQLSIKPKTTVHPTTLSAHDTQTIKIQSIRSAIQSLGDHQPVTTTSSSFIKRRPDLEQHVQAYLRDRSQLDEQHDSLPAELSNFMRIASENTKKMLRKIKVPHLTSKKLWKRNHAEDTEGASSASLGSAGPSGHYQLPQDMSPVSNTSPGASAGSGDMDTPFNAGIEQTRHLDNYWGQDQDQDGYGLLRRKASGALKYMQKWKVVSRVGALIPTTTARNESADVDESDTVWNSTRGDRSASTEDSVRKRIARSLSF